MNPAVLKHSFEILSFSGEPTYIPQKQAENLGQLLAPGKVLVRYGARRVGKTTLLKNFAARYRTEHPDEANRILMVSGDDLAVHDYLGRQS